MHAWTAVHMYVLILCQLWAGVNWMVSVVVSLFVLLYVMMYVN
jgi:hypothetical protein